MRIKLLKRKYLALLLNKTNSLTMFIAGPTPHVAAQVFVHAHPVRSLPPDEQHGLAKNQQLSF